MADSNELLALASALSIRAGDTPEQVDARVQRALIAFESVATPVLPAPVNVAERDAGRELDRLANLARTVK